MGILQDPIDLKAMDPESAPFRDPARSPDHHVLSSVKVTKAIVFAREDQCYSDESEKLWINLWLLPGYAQSFFVVWH